MILEKVDIHKQKLNLTLNLTPYTKTNSKQISELKGKCKTIKQYKNRRNVWDIRLKLNTKSVINKRLSMIYKLKTFALQNKCMRMIRQTTD